MTNHTVWGHASDALYTLHTKNAAEMEYTPDEPIHSQFVLGLFNAAGDGIALGRTRRELLTYLRTAIEHIERETDPRGELDQVLRRLHTLRHASTRTKSACSTTSPTPPKSSTTSCNLAHNRARSTPPHSGVGRAPIFLPGAPRAWRRGGPPGGGQRSVAPHLLSRQQGRRAYTAGTPSPSTCTAAGSPVSAPAAPCGSNGISALCTRALGAGAPGAPGRKSASSFSASFQLTAPPHGGPQPRA